MGISISMKKEFISLIESASEVELEKIFIALNFFVNAPPLEKVDLKKQLKIKDFDVNAWVESKRTIVSEKGKLKNHPEIIHNQFAKKVTEVSCHE